MRNLLALLGLALVAFAVVGWFRGWYQFQTVTEPDGHRDVKIEINGPKIDKDVHQGAQTLEKAIESKINKTPGNTSSAPAPSPANAPAPVYPPPVSTPPGYPQGEQYVLPPVTAPPVHQPGRPGGMN
jgi:hypothetical protein